MKNLPLFLIASLLTITSPLFGLHAQEDIKLTASTVIQDNNFSGRGNDNEEILRIELQTTGSREVAFGSLVMNLNGTTDINDIEEIKIYSTGVSVKFDPRKSLVKGAQLLAKAAPKEGEITIPLKGETSLGINNIWITFKVKETAKEGNQLDAEVISISTEAETHRFENGNPEGSREILLRRTLVYGPGDYGSANYRIPAITTAADGSLVILTDKRKNNSIDLPEDIDIVANRSTDGGKTWSEPFLVAEGQGYGKGLVMQLLLVKYRKVGCAIVGGPGLWGSTAENPQHIYFNQR